MMYILRNEVDQVLKRIARQKQADIGGAFEDCYDETKADYVSGAITDEFIEFALKNPDAQIVLGYGESGEGE
jgi:hypothetical protein